MKYTLRTYKGNNIFDAVNADMPLSQWSKFQLWSLWDMVKFKADIFYAIAQDIELVRANTNMLYKSGESKAISPLIREEHPKTLKAIILHCKSVGLVYSIQHIERMLDCFEGKSGNYDCERLAHDSRELHHRMIDEMESILFLRVPKERADYYEQLEPFGASVPVRFPSSIFDIEEASKCFATARYTACVMHLQRVLEVALKSYATYLGVMHLIPTPQPSWHTVLEKTGKEIKDRNDKSVTSTNWASKEEREFCEGVQPFLVAVKIAWRNPAMHADKTYTEERAREIFNAVQTFMQHLAAHLDEAGNFTA